MSDDDWGSDDDGGWGDDDAEASATLPPAPPAVAIKQMSADWGDISDDDTPAATQESFPKESLLQQHFAALLSTYEDSEIVTSLRIVEGTVRCRVHDNVVSIPVDDKTYPKCECTVSLGKSEENQEYHIFTGMTLEQILTKIAPLAENYSETGWGNVDTSDDDGAYEEDAGDTTAGLPENLVRDIEEISSRFESRLRPQVSFNRVINILYVTMELNPKLYLPNRMFASAWGIQFDLPIHIELKFSAELYTKQDEPPSVRVYQVQGKPFVLAHYLQSLVDDFCQQLWPKRGDFSGSVDKSPTPPKAGASVPSATKPQWSEAVMSLMTIFPAHDPYLLQAALRLSKGDIQGAANKLFDPCEIPALDEMAEQIRNPVTSTSQSKRIRVERSSSASDIKTSALSTALADGFGGFLMRLAFYITQRLPHLNSYCVICDKPHMFCTMMKPAVCSHPFCVFRFQEIGVRNDMCNGVAQEPELINLLVLIAKAAINSKRRKDIFMPYPLLYAPGAGKDSKPILTPKNKNFALVETILNEIPSVDVLTKQQNESELRSMLQSRHQMCYPIINWLMESNQSHIVTLPDEFKIQGLETPFQFIMLSSPPAKEILFQKLKKTHGSTFAFHGSAPENWHSIMRNGLMNASNTKFMTAGAAHGAGIYLSPVSTISAGYSRMTPGRKAQRIKKRSTGAALKMDYKKMWMIAICECIDDGWRHRSPTIWVQPDPAKVCTRFFFIFDSPSMPTFDCEKANKNEILHAMKRFNYTS